MNDKDCNWKEKKAYFLALGLVTKGEYMSERFGAIHRRQANDPTWEEKCSFMKSLHLTPTAKYLSESFKAIDEQGQQKNKKWPKQVSFSKMVSLKPSAEIIHEGYGPLGWGLQKGEKRLPKKRLEIESVKEGEDVGGSEKFSELPSTSSFDFSTKPSTSKDHSAIVKETIPSPPAPDKKNSRKKKKRSTIGRRLKRIPCKYCNARMGTKATFQVHMQTHMDAS